MYKDPAQNIGTASVKINYDNELYDIGSIADPTTNNRFDIRRAGVYTVSHSSFLGVDSNNDTVRTHIYVDGSAVRESRIMGYYGATTSMGATITTSLYLTSGQYVVGWVKQEDSPSYNTFTDVNLRPQISIVETR